MPTSPLDSLITGIMDESIGSYRKAFPPDYWEQLCKEYEGAPQTFAETLTTIHSCHVFNAGDDFQIRYTLLSEESTSLSDIETEFWTEEPFVFRYQLPVDSVQSVRNITFRVDIEGKSGSSSGTMTYTVLQIGNLWYLHPQYFGTSLLY